jgi:ABC-type branched-subunit amino acid transport system substrate-binding protein
MRRRRSTIWALAVAIALVVAACGGGTTTETTTGGADTTAAADTTTAPDTTASATGDITTDFGVDLEEGTISVGLLSDLTGPFGPLVTSIVTGQEVFWENVNRSGGINGLTVELVVRDTQYDLELHPQLYQEIKDQVVALGHSTGSPHTMAIRGDLEADGMLAVPLTWYSGWTDPNINANILHHGSPYCIESMNLLGYVAGAAEEPPATVALASVPGDYGLDGMAGAKLAIDALGLEIVYDGSGMIDPTPGADVTPIAGEIAAADPDVVFMTTNSATLSSIYGAALASNFEAAWTGNGPNWNPGLIAPDSPIKDAIARDWIGGIYIEPWGGESAGIQEVMDLVGELRPDAPPNDYYGEGFVEAQILYQALLRAYENGDMTRAGVLAAAKSLEDIDFNGLAPNETFIGEPNDQVQRVGYIFRPDPEDLASGGTGTSVVEAEYTSEIAGSYEFNEACYLLEG